MLGGEYQPVILVTPFVGVWIEIATSTADARHVQVTPFVGVWIEIKAVSRPAVNAIRHSLRGSVD